MNTPKLNPVERKFPSPSQLLNPDMSGLSYKGYNDRRIDTFISGFNLLFENILSDNKGQYSGLISVNSTDFATHLSVPVSLMSVPDVLSGYPLADIDKIKDRLKEIVISSGWSELLLIFGTQYYRDMSVIRPPADRLSTHYPNWGSRGDVHNQPNNFIGIDGPIGYITHIVLVKYAEPLKPKYVSVFLTGQNESQSQGPVNVLEDSLETFISIMGKSGIKVTKIDS